MNTRIDGASCQIIPDDLYTSGEPSLNRLAAAAGDRFDVWQRQINRIILAKSADGFWSARNAVLSIPRQTGKTYDIGWVAIHRAARTPRHAHRVDGPALQRHQGHVRKPVRDRPAPGNERSR